MRALFDRRVTDPTADEVADALRAGIAATNARHDRGLLSSLDDVAPHIAQGLFRDAAGRCAWFGGSQVYETGQPSGRLALAWWTSPTGRKLVRIRGWRELELRTNIATVHTDVAFQAVQRDLHTRPAIWHLEPERVVETFTAGDPEWVAVCGCGAAGSAESLGWHHGMCGPCADRVAEYGADAVRHAPGLLTADNFELRDVVFTGDGKFVVACGNKQIHAWDVATGDSRLRGVGFEVDPAVRPAAASDGPFVAFSDQAHGTIILDLPADRLESPFSFDLEAREAHWTGRPHELLVQSAANRLYLADAHGGHARELARPLDSRARLCALHPHAERPRAVFAHNGLAAVVRIRDDGTLIEEWRFLLGHGRVDRTGMWNGGPQIVRFSPDGERILFVRGSEVELRLPERSKALQQVEFPRPITDAHFSADGEWVYFPTDTGIHVCHLGMLANVRARLRWHIGDATRMAVSPDGRTLATAGAEGVKLWAVASLLPLLE